MSRGGSHPRVEQVGVSAEGVTGEMNDQTQNNETIETAAQEPTAKTSDKHWKFYEFKLPSGRTIPSLVDPATGNSPIRVRDTRKIA